MTEDGQRWEAIKSLCFSKCIDALNILFVSISAELVSIFNFF